MYSHMCFISRIWPCTIVATVSVILTQAGTGIQDPWLAFDQTSPPATEYKQTVSSIQFSCSVVSNSLQPHELQHARPPCPSPTPRVYSNSCPSSRWCRLAISSPVVPFSSCPQSLPESGSLPMGRVNTSHEVAKVLEFQLQHQSFQWTPRTDLL